VFVPTKTNPNDHDSYHYCSRFLPVEPDRWHAHLRASPRHVRVARGPHERARARHHAPVRRVRPQDHVRLRAHQRELFFSSSLAYKDLDTYIAAWRDAIVKALLAYRATSDRLFSVVLDRRSDEQCFLKLNGGKAAKKHPKARAHRAWRHNAERMERNWTLSL
jgi:hypothetical protein